MPPQAIRSLSTPRLDTPDASPGVLQYASDRGFRRCSGAPGDRPG